MMRVVVPLALSAVLALGLSGCFSNPLDQLNEGIVEGVVEGATGVDVDVSGDGTGASLPAGWPAEVAVPPGKIVASFGLDGTYSATIEIADADAGQAGLDALVASGFEVTSESDFGGGFKSYTLANATYGVAYAWGDDGSGFTVLNISVSSTNQ